MKGPRRGDVGPDPDTNLGKTGSGSDLVKLLSSVNMKVIFIKIPISIYNLVDKYCNKRSIIERF